MSAESTQAQATSALGEHASVLQMVGRLASTRSEEQAVTGIAEMFMNLFAPRNVCYVPVVEGVAGRGLLFPEGSEPDLSLVERMCALRESYRWDGEDSLVLRVGSAEETLGFVEVYGFFQEADRQRHVGLAVSLAGVCALAIRNARIFERLQKIVVDREALANELAGKNRELESVLYTASHDLRSPLVNIQGFARRLESACNQLAGLFESPGTPEPLRDQSNKIIQETIPKALSFINSSIIKMDGVIAGLLALSRIGRVVLRREILDMNRLLKLCVASMAYQVERAQATIDIEGALPACNGDPTLVSQVFSNLLDNAIKYKAPDRQLKIRVSGVIEGDMAVYCVSDNGIGIPPEQSERIWELFFRGNPGGPVSGEGLGLNMARRIIDRHGGRVWMESAPGEGSRFFVAIPADPGVIPK